MRRQVTLPSFNGVAPGQTATCDLPTDRRYFGLELQYKTNADLAARLADITEIRLKVNGRVKRRIKPLHLLGYNAIDRREECKDKPGIFPIYFAEPDRRSAQGEDALAWGMVGVDTFQIEVDISGTAVSPTLGGIMDVDNAQVRTLLSQNWYVQRVQVASTGITSLSTLPKTLGSYSKLLAFEGTAGDISDIQVVVDDYTVRDLTGYQNAAHLVGKGYNPNPSEPITGATMFPVIFDDTRRISDALPMVYRDSEGRVTRRVADFRVDFTMSQPASFDLLSVVNGPLLA